MKTDARPARREKRRGTLESCLTRSGKHVLLDLRDHTNGMTVQIELHHGAAEALGSLLGTVARDTRENVPDEDGVEPDVFLHGALAIVKRKHDAEADDGA